MKICTHLIDWHALRLAIVAATSIALAACGSFHHADEAVLDDQPTKSLAVKEPVPALVPGPEGTPLPPRDLRIAERWPPEIKQVVDKMLSLYQRPPGRAAPSTAEVEQRMGFTLKKQEQSEALRGFHQNYEISGSRFIAPGIKDRTVLGDFFRVSDRKDSKEESQSLQLAFSPAVTGYCLDPYEVAVYTGAAFMNAHFASHSAIKQRPPAYVWGMFAWSESGNYMSPGLRIRLVQRFEDLGRKNLISSCVSAIGVSAIFNNEPK